MSVAKIWCSFGLSVVIYRVCAAVGLLFVEVWLEGNGIILSMMLVRLFGTTIGTYARRNHAVAESACGRGDLAILSRPRLACLHRRSMTRLMRT